MNEQEYEDYERMVRSYQERDDPLGWFDGIYSQANGDPTQVFWADLEPSPLLTDWLAQNPPAKGLKAIAVGCGVGDDAEALSAAGYEVTAFDVAPSAIDLCVNRYPETQVRYQVANLFDPPPEWREAFDLVYECNTIQVLPGDYRTEARDAMIGLIAPGGSVLVSCRSRNAGEKEDAIPLPLDKHEIDGFVRRGLTERSFLAYDDTQSPPVPHFFAWYQRAGGGS